MNFIITFYIFLFYLTLTIICYCILGFVKTNKFNSLLSIVGLGENFILASFITFGLYLYFRIYIDNEMEYTPKIKYSKFEEHAKTGDLIIYRWKCVDVGFRMFSKYCHVAMIVKKDNKLYLLETHPNEYKDTKKKNNQGVHLYSLKNRLRQYDGDYYLVPLNHNINRNKLANDIINDLKTFKKIPFDSTFRESFVYNYLANKIGINIPKKNEMFCSEFIGFILHKYNIYRSKEKLLSIEPGSFLYFINNKNNKIFKSIKQICINKK